MQNLEVENMGFGQYLVWYIIQGIGLLAIGCCGAFIGIKLRKKKDAKLADDKTVE